MNSNQLEKPLSSKIVYLYDISPPPSTISFNEMTLKRALMAHKLWGRFVLKLEEFEVKYSLVTDASLFYVNQ